MLQKPKLLRRAHSNPKTLRGGPRRNVSLRAVPWTRADPREQAQVLPSHLTPESPLGGDHPDPHETELPTRTEFTGSRILSSGTQHLRLLTQGSDPRKLARHERSDPARPTYPSPVTTTKHWGPAQPSHLRRHPQGSTRTPRSGAAVRCRRPFRRLTNDIRARWYGHAVGVEGLQADPAGSGPPRRLPMRGVSVTWSDAGPTYLVRNSGRHGHDAKGLHGHATSLPPAVGSRVPAVASCVRPPTGSRPARRCSGQRGDTGSRAPRDWWRMPVRRRARRLVGRSPG